MKIRSIGITLTLIIMVLCFSSCDVQPNPLVGAWADNSGDTITFMADKTFLAKITNPTTKQLVDSEGEYEVLLNVITFVNKSGQQRVSEWDIRGNILYVTWTDDLATSIPLSLYKVRN